MAWRDRLSEARELAEERLGRSVVDTQELQRLQESDWERRMIQKDLDMLAYTALNYVGHRPQELKAVERRRLAQRSRITWMKDPQAGAAVDLMNDFVFGRGMKAPKANDPQVQQVLDDFWNDPDNQLVLTSYQAQLALGTDLELQSNLFFLVFEDGRDGKVKLGLLDHDTVETVVRDTENRLRILYYLARHFDYRWNFQTDQPQIVVGVQSNTEKAKLAPAPTIQTTPGYAMNPVLTGQGQVRYYSHWRNVEDAKGDMESGARDEDPDLFCPDEKLGAGKVYHVALNRGSEMAFGHPRMDRLIRWFSCHAEQTETLTDEGWLSYEALRQRWHAGTMPNVAAMDMITNTISYEQPTAMHTYPYTGEMVRFMSGRGGMNALVTPNHDMLVRGKYGDWTKVEAGKLSRQDSRELYVPRTAPKVAARVESFLLPGVPVRTTREKTAAWHEQAVVMAEAGATPNEIALAIQETTASVRDLLSGRLADRRKHHAPMDLPMDAWLEYVGWYVAEGYGDGVVTQSMDSPVLGDLMACCERLGVDGTPYRSVRADGKYSDSWSWTPRPRKQFGQWLREHCGEGALNKRLPEFVFQLDHTQQTCVLTGLLKGDGTAGPGWTPSDPAVFYTSSPQLADDCQRLAIGSGLIATRRASRRGEFIVHVSPPRPSKLPEPRREHYSGDVFCLSMPSGTMITRLGGRTAISGNSFNTFMDARVDMMSATAAFVMKRKVRGTPQQLQRMATQALSRRSVLGMSTEPQMMADIGPKAGGIVTENDSVDHEPFNLNSNAQNAMADAQMLRSQISAGTRWPASYYGDASQANLATATSLELPVLKTVESRQEIFEQVVRFGCDRAIERAVDCGILDPVLSGNEEDQPEKQPAPTNLEPGDATVVTTQQGYEDQQDDESDTQRDLGYEFSMPNPLKRLIGDLVTAAQLTAQAFDPNNSNTELSRTLLSVVLAEAFEIEDPAGAVERIFPKGYVDPATAQQLPSAPGSGGMSGQMGEFSPDGSGFGGGGGFGQDPNNGYSQGFGAGNPYGAVSSSQAPENAMEARMVQEEQEILAHWRERAAKIERDFDDEVLDLVMNGDAHKNGSGE